MERAKQEQAGKMRELTGEELKSVSGGTGAEGKKYSFRVKDYVLLDAADRFIIDENVDTDDGAYKVSGHKRTSGHVGRVTQDEPMKKSASTLYTAFKNNGGSLSAME